LKQTVVLGFEFVFCFPKGYINHRSCRSWRSLRSWRRNRRERLCVIVVAVLVFVAVGGVELGVESLLDGLTSLVNLECLALWLFRFLNGFV
jgi:hypothetical protein